MKDDKEYFVPLSKATKVVVNPTPNFPTVPFPIEEPNVFTLTLRTDVLNAKMDKILASLGRIEDMVYYYTHGIKQPE